MNAFPNAATTSSGPSPPAIPVARPATVTTNSGFIPSTNPTTTMTIPIRENIGVPGYSLGLERSEAQSSESGAAATRSTSDPVVDLHLKHVRRTIPEYCPVLRPEIEVAVGIEPGATLRPHEEHRRAWSVLPPQDGIADQ